METCRTCGAFLMQGWDRCKICGAEPAAASPPPASPVPAGQPPPTPPGRSGAARPPARRALAPVALVVGAVVLLGAGYIILVQSGDDGPATRDDYVEAILLGREEEWPGLGDVDWDCLAAEMVDALGGAETLDEAGIEPEELAGEEGFGDFAVPPGGTEQLAAGMRTCGVDGRALLLSAMPASDDPTLTPEVVNCIVAAVDPTITDLSLAAEILGEPSTAPSQVAFEEHMGAVTSICLS